MYISDATKTLDRQPRVNATVYLAMKISPKDAGVNCAARAAAFASAVVSGMMAALMQGIEVTQGLDSGFASLQKAIDGVQRGFKLADCTRSPLFNSTENEKEDDENGRNKRARPPHCTQ